MSATQKLIASISKISIKQATSLSAMVESIKELKADSYTLSTFATHSTQLSETLASEAQELSAQLSFFIK